MKLFVLAGGLGTRMRPVSFAVPKPLVAHNKKPILEYVIENALKHGIDDITISLGYGAELIRAYCGVKGWNIKFVEESEPLGTAGSLGMLDFEGKTVIVMNGDLVTNLDLSMLGEAHIQSKSGITVVCKNYEHTINLGTIDMANGQFMGMVERPKINYLINCGIYAVSPHIKPYIGTGYLDFPTLVNRVFNDDEWVGLFNLSEHGFDWKAIETVREAEGV